MATPFEGLTLLENFSFIFPFLLVLVMIYGLLSWIKLFGDNKGVNALIALVFAVLALLSPIVRGTINTMSPWFVLFFFFIIFSLVAFKIFGFTDADIMGVMSGRFRYINWWIIAIVIIIALGSLMHTLSKTGGLGSAGSGDSLTQSDNGGESASVSSSSQEDSFWATLVHPKVLGFILLMLIALFSVQRLTASV